MWAVKAKFLIVKAFAIKLEGRLMKCAGFKLGSHTEKGTKAVIIAVSGLLLAACTTTTGNMFQGQEVLVAGRQDILERDVFEVSDNHRELRDRFDALERLYVELVHEIRSRDQKMAALEAHVNKVQKDPQIAATIKRVSNDVSVIMQQMKKLENRVFSVELSDPNGGMEMAQMAPTGTTETSAAVKASAEIGTPVSNKKPEDKVFYGVHLASYRSQEQVDSGWAGLEQTFGANLKGLTPLIYTQSQEGIGTFLRLIAGPLINEQEAVDLCGRIRQTAAEQYCRVAEYQGEPVG